MILYNKPGLTFIARKWQALVNLPNIFLGALILVCIALGIYTNWDFLFWIMSFYTVIIVLVRIFMLRKARPVLIETLDDRLRLIYSKYFRVYNTELPNDDVKIEFYDSPYNRKGYRPTEYYLYFYSHSNDKLDVEFAADYPTIAKLLISIQQEQKIQLSPRELGVIEKYHEAVEWSKTTQGKIIRFLYPVLYLAGIALILYMCMPED